MTTQPHYGSYPTAPPWATPPQGQPAAVPPPPPVASHGQLMVPHPELMHAAGRPQPPSWVPVLLYTFFIWPLGLAAAVRRSRQATQAGHGVQAYWLAFAVMLVAAVLAWRAVLTALQ